MRRAALHPALRSSLLLGAAALLGACSGAVADALRSGCLAGCGQVPGEHTSLGRDPGADPGRPAGWLTMVWLHHSTGDRLLNGGLRGAITGNRVAFHDINYGEAAVGSYVIGDHTDPPDFPTIFNNPGYLAVVLGWELPGGQQHRIVMFKSCYPASAIQSEAMLTAYRGYYRSLLPAFCRHPDVLFVPMTPPPLVASATNPADAARARRWARWLTTDYARDLRNVQVFDLFDALAIRDGRPDANTLAPQFAERRGDSHPSVNGARAVARMFIPWLNRALRASGLVP